MLKLAIAILLILLGAFIGYSIAFGVPRIPCGNTRTLTTIFMYIAPIPFLLQGILVLSLRGKPKT